LFIEGLRGGEMSHFKTMVTLETHPKELMGRKVKTTPDIVMKFLQQSIENSRDSIDFNEE